MIGMYHTQQSVTKMVSSSGLYHKCDGFGRRSGCTCQYQQRHQQRCAPPQPTCTLSIAQTIQDLCIVWA